MMQIACIKNHNCDMLFDCVLEDEHKTCTGIGANQSALGPSDECFCSFSRVRYREQTIEKCT